MNFTDFYNSYEVQANDKQQVYRLPQQLIDDFKECVSNQSKAARQLIIEFLFKSKMEGLVSFPSEITPLFNSYEVLPNDGKFCVKLPSNLLDDFKIATCNQSKSLRTLMVEYIYNHNEAL